jgi:arylsulfatase A-like enzyme
MPRLTLRPVLLGAACLAGLGFARAAASSIAPAAPPNIVFFLLDDLGWGDLACYGNPHVRTPHIDRLAREGTRFTDAYAAAPVCSPARAGLFTGRWPARVGVTDAIGEAGIKWNGGRRVVPPPNASQLALAEITLADALRASGYATASIGKWHLGGEGFLAQDQGFEVNFSGNRLGSHKSMFGPDYGIGLPSAPAGEYLTDRLQSEAEAFISRHRERPFFVVVSHYAVHRPVAARPETVARQPAKSSPPWGLVPEYAAMIEDADTSVGRMTQFLREQGLERRTVIVFTSDNGAVRWWGSNGGLRGTKGTLYDGGSRVPLIVRLPDGTGAGRVSSAPVHGCDLFPTLLALAGRPLPAGLRLDGTSLVPLLRGAPGFPAERPLFWHYPHYNMHGATPASAVRAGDLKLIEFFEDGRRELYDLRADPGETQNLATERPELVTRLAARLAEFRKDTGALLPKSNPAYAGVEPELPELRPFESTRTVPGVK